MSYEEINNRLKQIKIEDYVWLIYIGIIFLSWYSNNLERDYLINNNEISKEKYHNILVFIFLVLLIIYLYFFKGSLDDFLNLKFSDSEKKKELVTLAFIGMGLFVVGGIIFLYIAIEDKNIDVELAFN